MIDDGQTEGEAGIGGKDNDGNQKKQGFFKPKQGTDEIMKDDGENKQSNKEEAASGGEIENMVHERCFLGTSIQREWFGGVQLSDQFHLGQGEGCDRNLSGNALAEPVKITG